MHHPFPYILASGLILPYLPFGGCANVFTRFYVEQGQGSGGSCASVMQNTDLNAIYNEAIDMAQAALDALADYGTDPVVRAEAQTFLGIQPNDADDGPASSYQLSTAKAAFQQVIDDSSNTYSASFEPGLFCDESWQYLTHLEIDTTTGGFTGRTISEKSNGANQFEYWSPWYLAYTGTYLVCAGDLTGAFAYQMDNPATITFCPKTWNSPNRIDSLAAYRAQDTIADGTPLASFSSVPATLLHEIFHLVTQGGIDDQTVTIDGVTLGAYTPEQVAALATEDVNKNLKNAESYTWFAVASYLEFYDWSRTIAGTNQYVATSNARRSLRNETSGSTAPYSLGGQRKSKEFTFHDRRSDTRGELRELNVRDAAWWASK